MSESANKTNPNLDPLTVGHGQKLYDQSKAIEASVEQLKPLLGLLDESQESEIDPITQIVELLTMISETQKMQAERQERLDHKLDFIIANLSDAEPSAGSK